MGNMGHRLGGDILPHPENTLQCLNSAKGLQVHKKFRYWEFDVNETKDGELIVYHNDSFQGKPIREWSSKDLLTKAKEELELEIPLLSDVLESLADSTKPLRIEIKDLHSDAGRQKFIDMVASARDEHGWNCKAIAWKERFRDVFPKEDRLRWSKAFEEKGLRLCRVGMHHVDLFKAHNSTVGRMMFTLGIGPIAKRSRR